MPDGWFVDGYSVRVFRDRNRSLGGHNRSFAAAVVPAIPTIGFGKAVKLGAWLAEAICRNNRYALRDARSGEGT